MAYSSIVSRYNPVEDPEHAGPPQWFKNISSLAIKQIPSIMQVVKLQDCSSGNGLMD
jgi:hypothetical protein